MVNLKKKYLVPLAVIALSFSVIPLIADSPKVPQPPAGPYRTFEPTPHGQALASPAKDAASSTMNNPQKFPNYQQPMRIPHARPTLSTYDSHDSTSRPQLPKNTQEAQMKTQVDAEEAKKATGEPQYFEENYQVPGS